MTDKWPIAPYSVGPPVEDDIRFAGRESLLLALRDRVLNPLNEGFVLTGPRRLGKTSILRRLRRGLSENAFVVYIDLNRLLGYDDVDTLPIGSVTSTVLRSIVEAVDESFPGVLSARLHEIVRVGFDVAQFRREILPELCFAVHPRRLVVFLDEVEVAAMRDPHAPNQLAASLLSTQAATYAPAFIGAVWGRPFGHGSADLSSLFQNFQPFPVDRLTYDEFLAAISKPLLGAFSWVNAASRAWDLTQGHPLFSSALAAAVLENRREGDSAPVSPAEVDKAALLIANPGGVPRALKLAETWEDAWRQINQPAQRVLLRVTAERTEVGLKQILEQASEWGASLLTEADFRSVIPGLEGDGVIKVDPNDLIRFQVPIMAQWVLHRGMEGVLSQLQGPDATPTPASSLEDQGVRLYEARNLQEAAAAFRAAFALDPSRTSAALRLAQVLREDGKPERAADVLRNAPPEDLINQARAHALAEWLDRATATGEPTSDIIAEFRSVDPYFRHAPGAMRALARFEAAKWWEDLLDSKGSATVEVTKRLVTDRGSAVSLEALRAARYHAEAILDSGVDLSGYRDVICIALPALLLDTVPTSEHDHTDSGSDSLVLELRDSWFRCYETVVRCLDRLVASRPTLGDTEGVPPSTFRKLLATPARPDDKTILIGILDRLLTTDRLAELVLQHPDTARAASQLLRFLSRRSAFDRAQNGLADAVLKACEGDSSQVQNVMRALPQVAFALLAIARDDAVLVATVKHDIISTAALLLERAQGDPSCASIAHDPEIATNWDRVLMEFGDVNHAEAERLRRGMKDWVSAVQTGASAVSDFNVPSAGRLDSGLLQSLLGAQYTIVSPVPYPIVGVPSGSVMAWRVRRGNRELLARAYRVESGDRAERSLLTHLWENERRLLSALSTRWEGRALPRLHSSRLHGDRNLLILLTDYDGPLTLRDLLSSGAIPKLRATSRMELWRQLQPLVEGLASLHKHGYIHRAFRPEHIMVNSESQQEPGYQRLRLAKFEWSVYTRTFVSAPIVARVFRDRYMAPEELPQKSLTARVAGVSNVGVATDAFALGLTLFECLVEPLRDAELRAVSHDYDQQSHEDWIRQLLRRVDEARSLDQLWPEEVQLLRDLLEPNAARREADVASLLDSVAEFCTMETRAQAARLTEPLIVVTTLDSQTPEALLNFIPSDLRDASLDDRETFAGWIQDQLRDAVVRPNRSASAPLLLMGRQLNFTVQPFQFGGTRHRHIGWLRIATDEDSPAGAALGTIPSGVKVMNYRRDMQLAPLLLSPVGWAPWFEAVDRMFDGMTTEERSFLDRVRWTVEIERASWQRFVKPYRVEEYTPGERPGDLERVRIRDRGEAADGRPEIENLVIQAMDRDEAWFDLASTNDPTAPFHPDRRWIYAGENASSELTTHLGSVVLTRRWSEGAEVPKMDGFIRPYSLAGHRSLYQRHKDVLADVEHDLFLVRALHNPSQLFDDLNLPPAARTFDRHLDDDKQQLCQAIQNRRPLFVVQGPPGTGKTTLAAEVVLRTLHENPSARILVVCQAHEPLNNLLERVEGAFDEWTRGDPRVRRPSVVRLTSEERLDERRFGAEGSRIPRKFHPSRVASRIMESASVWRGGAGDVKEAAAEAWRRFSEDEAALGLSRSLERRLVGSASIVYATANDRRLAAIRPGSFDLVIYEEAAKALPVEIIGPMRLARRWLLIGDQEQLPPFGIEQIQAVLEDNIGNLRESDLRRYSAYAQEGVQSDDRVSDLLVEMTQLFRFFRMLYNRTSAIDDGRQLDTNKPNVTVRGLSGMLTTQWRMHPVIGTFVSQNFYQGRIHNGDDARLRQWRSHGLTTPEFLRNNAIVWLDIPWAGTENLATEYPAFGGGYENGFEARVVTGFLRALLAKPSSIRSLAVISPYRAQVSSLQRLLRDYHFPSVGSLSEALHTADSFQGKQADVVVVSLVRNNRHTSAHRGLGFLENPERNTVIFSRAERLLVIVGSLRHFRRFGSSRIAELATQVELLDQDRKSGVAIIEGHTFMEKRHWDALERNHVERMQSRNR